MLREHAASDTSTVPNTRTLINHGVPEDLVAAQFREARNFFGLPETEKLKIVADANNRGFTPMSEETLDPANQARGDTKEGLYFGGEVPADSPEASKPLHGPNQWPDPALLPNFRSTMMQYLDACTQLGHRLVRLVAKALGLPADYFADKFDPPMVYLRPLHYSGERSDPDAGIFGAGAHSDYGMLTILATDGTPGLQIHVHGEWLDVAPVPGSFIINIGDMLERWTNGKFKSTVHRVVNSSGMERYSTPFFFEPNFDAVVECLPQCCEDDPAKYPSTTAGQHLLSKYAATHSGFEL